MIVYQSTTTLKIKSHPYRSGGGLSNNLAVKGGNSQNDKHTEYEGDGKKTQRTAKDEMGKALG